MSGTSACMVFFSLGQFVSNRMALYGIGHSIYRHSYNTLSDKVTSTDSGSHIEGPPLPVHAKNTIYSFHYLHYYYYYFTLLSSSSFIILFVIVKDPTKYAQDRGARARDTYNAYIMILLYVGRGPDGVFFPINRSITFYRPEFRIIYHFMIIIVSL